MERRIETVVMIGCALDSFSTAGEPAGRQMQVRVNRYFGSVWPGARAVALPAG